jgi:hypothetical protein
MDSSDTGGSIFSMVGVVALAALALALGAQVAAAEAAISSPDGQPVPNAAWHAASGSHKAGPVAASGPVTRNTRTITVTTTVDGVPGSLRASIAEARPGDTIAVPPGTYVLTKGELKIEKSLVIAGAGAGRTTIDGNEETRAFAIQIPPREKNEVTISGLTITKAVGRVPPFGLEGTGAAIASFSADLTLRDDVITRNVTKLRADNNLAFGGAVLANFGSFTMVGTTVSQNVVSVQGAGEFGGLVSGGGVDASGVNSAIVEDSKVVDNRALVSGGEFAFAFGGGMRIVSFGPALVSGSVFSGNVARADSGQVEGGGLVVIGEPARLVGDQVVGNLADAGAGTAQGGGVNFHGVGRIDGSLIEANQVLGADSLGGNLIEGPGFNPEEEHEITVSHTSILHGIGPAGSENCATRLEAIITSLGFNRESTDQCGFHAEGDEVNVG